MVTEPQKKSSKQTKNFKAETRQLLDLMIHSLYSNREIFLRELLSNASDAADRLRFAALSDDSLYEGDAELTIRVEFNKENRIITVMDNGIGMSEEDVVEQLGTIAKSGTRQFIETLSGDKKNDSQLIGQFGVGFYSAFIVAEKVEVHSRKAGLPRTEGVRWVSSGESTFSVETIDRPARGTKVLLHLRADADEFLQYHQLHSIIKKYSDHIAIPVIMPGDGKDAKEEQVNSATALWKRNKKDISKEEYEEFYKQIAHDFSAPLVWSHNHVEGKLDYVSLLYIPQQVPFDLWDRDNQRGIKLYVHRVFIMDDAKYILPPWLRFVRGVVDCDDLPLNVSRELLQHNNKIAAIRSGCIRNILKVLEKMAVNEVANYATFWEKFGQVLKEGVLEIGEHQQSLLKLFRFASTHQENEQRAKQCVSLAEYVERMQEGQDKIYVITADNYNMACSSPHLEIFRKKGVEVLIMTDPVDEWLLQHVNEYEGKPLVSVSKGDISLDGDSADKDKEGSAKTDKESKEKADGDNNIQEAKLSKRMQNVLAEKVQEVRASKRLTDSPVCLVSDEQNIGRQMEQMLKAAGQAVPQRKLILEFNSEHPVIGYMRDMSDEESFSQWCHLLFDQAVLSDGGQPLDLPAYIQRLNRLLLQLVNDKV